MEEEIDNNKAKKKEKYKNIKNINNDNNLANENEYFKILY